MRISYLRTPLRYLPTRPLCKVRVSHSVWWSLFLSHYLPSAIALRPCYAKSGTDIDVAYGVWRVRCAMRGADAARIWRMRVLTRARMGRMGRQTYTDLKKLNAHNIVKLLLR
eukprot:1176990-Rhodomonas_salina.1